MLITPIRTNKIKIGEKSLFKILDKYLPKIKEKSILVVTSKIISICEGNVIKTDKTDRFALIKKEAEHYLPPEKSKYGTTLTIKNGLLIRSAGVDESNGNGYYILWPKNPQKTANEIRKYLCQKFKLKNFGVIITDSKSVFLSRGTFGFALGFSGFRPLKNYIGQPDIFGKPLSYTKANIKDSLAIASVLIMGEGNEQTPLAIIENIPFVEFQSSNPTKKELSEIKITLEDDLYSPLLKSVKWFSET